MKSLYESILDDIDVSLVKGDEIIKWRNNWVNNFGDTETALKVFDKFANALKNISVITPHLVVDINKISIVPASL